MAFFDPIHFSCHTFCLKISFANCWLSNRRPPFLPPFEAWRIIRKLQQIFNKQNLPNKIMKQKSQFKSYQHHITHAWKLNFKANLLITSLSIWVKMILQMPLIFLSWEILRNTFTFVHPYQLPPFCWTFLFLFIEQSKVQVW